MLDLLSKQHIVAKEGFNRWLIAPAALGIHLCIGSVYAWSLFNPSLIKRLGVVTSAADDWTLKSVVWVFTVAIVFLGLSAAVAGKWLEKVGPRMVGTVAAFCWGGGFRGRRRRHPHWPTLATLPGVRCYRRLWFRAGLCLPCQHTYPLVSGQTRHGNGHCHYGLRWRRHDCEIHDRAFYQVILQSTGLSRVQSRVSHLTHR